MNVCAGAPAEKASINFKDTDMDEGEIAGEVKITKARNEFDIDHYVVYFGKGQSKLDPPLLGFVGEAETVGADTVVKVPQNTQIPDTATSFLVFSRNAYGEYHTPGSVTIKDAVLPKEKPAGLTFDDEDGEMGEVSGTVTIKRAQSEDWLDDYVLHWGRSATRKLASGSKIHEVHKQADKDPTHFISKSTKLPDGAT